MHPQRSTKDASKQRREQMNKEVNKMRYHLPFSKNIQDHLSQLDVMTLCNAFISKSHILKNSVLHNNSLNLGTTFDFSEIFPGFLLILTSEGKVVYLSENVLEYLGHSMVDILTRIDSIYDLVTKGDHKTIKRVLDNVREQTPSGVHLMNQCSFICQMGITKKFHQNLEINDQKTMKVCGWYSVSMNNVDHVFMGLCTPYVNSFAVTEIRSKSDTMIFTTVHGLHMKYLSISQNGEMHLGYSTEEIYFRSWYQYIHQDDIKIAANSHRHIMNSDTETSKPLCIRMQTKYGSTIYLRILMRSKRPMLSSDEGKIICINQVISENDGKETERKVKNEMESLPCQNDYTAASSSIGSCLESTTKSHSRAEVLMRLKKKMEMRGKDSNNQFIPSVKLNSRKVNSHSSQKIFAFDSYDFHHALQEQLPSMSYVPEFDFSGQPGEKNRSLCSSLFRPNCSFLSLSRIPSFSDRKVPVASCLLGSTQKSSFPFHKVPTSSFSIVNLPGNVCLSNPSLISSNQDDARKESSSSTIGISEDEQEEVVNVLEELMDRELFYEDKYDPRHPKEKLFSLFDDLPLLGPGTIDEFFQSVDHPLSDLEKGTTFEEESDVERKPKEFFMTDSFQSKIILMADSFLMGRWNAEECQSCNEFVGDEVKSKGGHLKTDSFLMGIWERESFLSLLKEQVADVDGKGFDDVDITALDGLMD